MSSLPRNDEASILSRAIAPDSGSWSPSVAHGVLSLIARKHGGETAEVNLALSCVFPPD